MTEKSAHPLCWPDHKPRTDRNHRKVNYNFQTSFADARDRAKEEIRLLGGSDLIISTNIPLKANGEPYAVGKLDTVPDPGVAVYFKRNGKQMCFACDRWFHIEDNMNAIALTINALRGIARWSTGDMMEAAFTGFQALPAPGQSGASQWWHVLGVPINAAPQDVRDAYRNLVKEHHPDTGGDPEKFIAVQAAYDKYLESPAGGQPT